MSPFTMPGRPPQPSAVNLVNLTGHAVRVFGANGKVVDIPAAKKTARILQEVQDSGHILVGDVILEMSTAKFGDITGVPEPQFGTVYVVSRLTAIAANRDDLVFPSQCVKGTGEENATVYSGCSSLCRVQR